MNYLERNEAILIEIAKVTGLRKHFEVGQGGVPVFHLGVYRSAVLDREVDVALKAYPSSRVDSNTRNALVVCETIADRYPHLQDHLPLFTGMLVSQEGTHLGLLTEDFSQARQHQVHDVYVEDSDIPEELYELFGRGKYQILEIAGMCFWVNGRLRLGDFSTIMVELFGEPKYDQFQFSEFEIDRHTVVLPYQL